MSFFQKYLLVFRTFFFHPRGAFTRKSRIVHRPSLSNPDLDKKLRSMLLFSVPVISAEAIYHLQKDQDLYLLDTREEEEFRLSHLPGAKHIGHKQLKINTLNSISKNSTLILYCSVGYRSEKIGEQVLRQGFKQVYHLYGGIFEWAEKGFPLCDNSGKPTKKIHTYNSTWSKWINHPEIEKIW